MPLDPCPCGLHKINVLFNKGPNHQRGCDMTERNDKRIEPEVVLAFHQHKDRNCCEKSYHHTSCGREPEFLQAKTAPVHIQKTGHNVKRLHHINHAVLRGEADTINPVQARGNDCCDKLKGIDLAKRPAQFAPIISHTGDGSVAVIIHTKHCKKEKIMG